jgi:hypothetical protein
MPDRQFVSRHIFHDLAKNEHTVHGCRAENQSPRSDRVDMDGIEIA